MRISDWSSDVCSSDLRSYIGGGQGGADTSARARDEDTHHYYAWRLPRPRRGMQILQCVNLQPPARMQVLQAFHGGPGAGDRGKERDAPGQRMRADFAGIGNGVTAFLYRIDHYCKDRKSVV